MSIGKRAVFDNIRQLDFDDMDDEYVEVGVAFTKSVRAIKITNTTDVPLYVSDDGTNDKLYLPQNSFELWDITANKALADLPQFLGIGKVISCRYVTGAAPTAGLLTVEALIVESGS